MPYLYRSVLPHRCELPDQRSEEPPVKGDVWQCPSCMREYRCTGWTWITSGCQFAVWRRIGRLSWWIHHHNRPVPPRDRPTSSEEDS